MEKIKKHENISVYKDVGQLELLPFAGKILGEKCSVASHEVKVYTCLMTVQFHA